MSKPSLIRRGFGAIGRFIDALRTLLGRLIFLFILVVIALVLFAGPAVVRVPQGATLVLAPKGTIVEQRAVANPLPMLLGVNALASTVLQDIVDVLAAAAADERVETLVLELDELTAISPVHIETIGAALERFKASGKPVLAYGSAFTQAQYALASHADTIAMHPMGNLLLSGYGGNQLFFAGLMERLKVTIHVFRAGTHKAAAEQFSRSDLSPEARENNQQLVDEFWAQYLQRVADNRGLGIEQLRAYSDNFATLLRAADNSMSQLALRQGLVDSLDSKQAFYLDMGQEGRPRIELNRYLQAVRSADSTETAEARVGLIVAQGTIALGEQQPGLIGADSLVSLIRQARRDEAIKALVLRLDTPGGVALASEFIREELQRVRDAGKPVVVSMGSTAASGGYWIATAADQVWASASTVTGSIGVIGMVPSFENTLAEIGISTDGVGTTPLSRGGDLLSGLSPEMADILQANVDDGYSRFLQLVADSRGMSIEQVDALAQGKVWSGARALELGLVDTLGELDQAVAAAAELAGLEDWQREEIFEPLSPGEVFLQQLITELGGVSSSLGSHALLAIKDPIEELWSQLSRKMQLSPLRAGSLQIFTLCDFCLGVNLN
ncbi:MAG: signal peptide peptidase SppA [Pseudomonadales bacterium]|nr:signal peptide peptidase SppA [Pseudomonadales bacterium]